MTNLEFFFTALGVLIVGVICFAWLIVRAASDVIDQGLNDYDEREQCDGYDHQCRFDDDWLEAHRRAFGPDDK